MKNNKVTVIIPIYNPDIKFLLETLSFLVFNNKKNIDRILLIDDGSPEPLSKNEKDIKLIWDRISIIRQLNKGAGGARNYGIKYSETEIVVFLDQDCKPTQGWLEGLIKPILDKKAIGVMGKILSFPNKKRVSLFLDFIKLLRFPSKNKFGEIRNIVTANAAFQKKNILEVGGFDERLKIAAEDFDLTHKLIKKGYQHRLAYVEDAIAKHDHRKTLKGLYKQFYGYGYGTMFHCILRKIDPKKIGFNKPNFMVICFSLFYFLVLSFKTFLKTPKKYGFLNKILFFPFFEYVRHFAQLKGHIDAQKEFVDKMEEFETIDVRKTVKIILKNKKEEFLVIHRPDGVYGLVGGGLKKEEDKNQALDRECLEELGINSCEIENLKYIGKQHAQGRINYHYEVDVFVGVLSDKVIKKIKLSDEHDAFYWFAINNVPFPLNINLKNSLSLY